MITLIGIVGYKKSGKDTLCNLLLEDWQNITPKRFAFADPLKKDIADWLKITVEDINRNKELFRPILQWYGTEYRRAQDEQYWVKRTVETILRSCPLQENTLAIITDVRFHNEAEMIRDCGGLLVRIDRGSSNDEHASEVNVSKIPVDKVIDNTGDLVHLEKQAKELRMAISQRFQIK